MSARDLMLDRVDWDGVRRMAKQMTVTELRTMIADLNAADRERYTRHVEIYSEELATRPQK